MREHPCEHFQTSPSKTSAPNRLVDGLGQCLHRRNLRLGRIRLVGDRRRTRAQRPAQHPAQLQTLAAYPASHPVCRVPVGETALIKQYLDLGAQNILVPMVDTAEQAAQLVQAMRYPQDDGLGGARGMAGARASRWGHYPDYFKRANEEVCLLVQVESRRSAEEPRCDCRHARCGWCLHRPGRLVGLAWAMWATPRTPMCRPRLPMRWPASSRLARRPASSRLTGNWPRITCSLGAVFVAVGLDTQLLMRQTADLAAHFKSAVTVVAPAKGATY